MPRLGPLNFAFSRGLPKMARLKEALGDSLKSPSIGVTQGGSSRKTKGAKVAATTGLFRDVFKPKPGE